MTQVERKPSLTAPFTHISETATDPHYGISSMWGSSLGPGGPQPYPSQNPVILSYCAPSFSPLPNSHFSPPDIPLLTQSTFSSVSQWVDSQHTHHYTSA